jgi:hypothetical protein
VTGSLADVGFYVFRRFVFRLRPSGHSFMVLADRDWTVDGEWLLADRGLKSDDDQSPVSSLAPYTTSAKVRSIRLK